MKFVCRFLLLSFLAGTVFAGEKCAARVDVSSSGKTEVGMAYIKGSNGTTATKAGWLKKRMDTRLVVKAAVKSQWREYWFSFIPKKNGEVDIILMSDSYKKQFWVWFDNVTVEGAKLVNGDFEQMAALQGKPGWAKSPEARAVNDGKAASGRYYVKVTHNKRIQQVLKVQKGKKVTVRFFARCADPVELDE